MSKKYVNTRIYQIKQSPLLIKGLVALHVVAIFSVFLNALIPVYKALIITVILLSLIHYIKKQSIDNKRISIRHSTETGWEITESEHYFFPVEILSSTVLTNYLIVLHFKTQNDQKKTILICKDALVNDNYRKLMVALKVSGLKKDVL